MNDFAGCCDSGGLVVRRFTIGCHVSIATHCSATLDGGAAEPHAATDVR